jgi:hypothetical protein
MPLPPANIDLAIFSTVAVNNPSELPPTAPATGDGVGPRVAELADLMNHPDTLRVS